ncbi:MAG: tryptophan synthase subunit alpha, partial [Armatimonadota bacterium]
MRLSSHLTELRERGEKALVVFFTAGDPSLSALPEIISSLVEGGA